MTQVSVTPDRPATPASPTTRGAKPPWLRVRMPGGDNFQRLRSEFRRLNLHTVCEEARCPNMGECWGQGTATIMVLGELCTRGCRFCSVKSGKPNGEVDADEPSKVAHALSQMNLSYVVLTMVDRDDLPDGGAEHVARTVREIHDRCPGLIVETLSGDFLGVKDDVRTLVEKGAPEVFSHNVEVVPSLQRVMRDARCSWDRSVEVLRWAKEMGAQVTKSSLMLGIGERESEVLDAMERLRDADVSVVTLGQYLQPTPKHATVKRFVTPDEFDAYRVAGERMGFSFVASGPLVRSSYKAAEAFLQDSIRNGRPQSMSQGTPHGSTGRHTSAVNHNGNAYGLRTSEANTPEPGERASNTTTRHLPVLS